MALKRKKNRPSLNIEFPWAMKKPSVGPAAITNATSVTDDNVTFNFSASMPVGQFEDGSYFVVSSQAFNITSVTPASSLTDGGQKNGLAVDPYLTTSQPFDQFIASGNASADVTYSSLLNIDPGATASPVAVSQGDNKSFVKAVRVAGMTSADGRWQTIDRYVVLTVLSTAPAAGSYRPGTASLTKTMLNKNDFNASALRSLTIPASFTDTPSQALAKVPKHLGEFGLNGERTRRMRLDVALGTTTTNYSRDIAGVYASCILYLHSSSISSTDRDNILKRVAVFASDYAGLYERGWVGAASRGVGAGQSGCVHSWMFAAAMVFGSSTMLTAARAVNSNMLSNGVWIDSSDFDLSTNGGTGVFAQAYLDEMVGEPWIVPDEETSEIAGRYTSIAGRIISMEAPVVALFQNGPGGVTGLEAMLNGANDNTNPRAASIAFLSTRREWSPNVLVAENVTTQESALFDLTVANVPTFQWTGQPQQIPYGTHASYLDPWFTAGDGAISFNVSAVDFATEAITQYDIRYSLDRRSWIQSNNVGSSGTVSSLLKGVQHFVQMRRHSASGISPWSSNHPRVTPISGQPARGAPTTTGTASAVIPVNTVAPVLVRNTRKNWEWGLWETAVSFDSTDITVSAAVGYWTGFPAPTFTFQWKRNGSTITGATTQNYTCQYTDLGQSLTCDVTATNASGSATVTTNGINAAGYEGFYDDFSSNTLSSYSNFLSATSAYSSGTVVVTGTGVSFQGLLSPAFDVTPGVAYTITAVISAKTGTVSLDMGTYTAADVFISASPNTAQGRISAAGTITWSYTPGAGVTRIKILTRNRNTNAITFTIDSLQVVKT